MHRRGCCFCCHGGFQFVDRAYVKYVETQEWRIWPGVGLDLDLAWSRQLKVLYRRLRQRCVHWRRKWHWNWNWRWRWHWHDLDAFADAGARRAEFQDAAGVVLDVPSEKRFNADSPRVFTYAELYVATRGFSEEELLGSGGFGRVFRARLPSDGSLAAVKCVSEKAHKKFMRTLEAELAAVGQLRHRNLVSLRGWCFRHHSLILVYDYMPNSSLDRLLFSGRNRNKTAAAAAAETAAAPLDWGRRYTIIQGLAAALFYLHEQLETQIIHRDVKTSNVMLDAAFNARLGDFGLARWVEHQADTDPDADSDEAVGVPVLSSKPSANMSNRHFRLADTSRIGGTLGYMPPESLQRRSQATAKSDVFSFGVVALEVASGRRAIDLSQPDDQIVLVDWIRVLHDEERLGAAADQRLAPGACDEHELRRLLCIGLLCSLNDPASRPKSKWIVDALRGDVDFPALPTFKTQPYYSALSLTSTSSSGDSLSMSVGIPTTATSASNATSDDKPWLPPAPAPAEDYAQQLMDAPRELSLEDIWTATDDFSAARMVVELDFGAAYRGILPGTQQQRVLVKRLGMKTCPALRTRFVQELSNLGRLRHRNLMQLRGWCNQRGELIVVYDGNLMNRPLSKLLMPPPQKQRSRCSCSGSCSSCSSSPVVVLDWAARCRVLQGLAAALLYLHEEWEQRVVHRGVTSSNVFLDGDLNPRLGGFALAQFIRREGDDDAHHQHHSSSAGGGVRGIFGYMAPEYAATGSATVEGDVYAFGVIVLEVVCGRAAVDLGAHAGDVLLAERARRLHAQGGLALLLDPRLALLLDPRLDGHGNGNGKQRGHMLRVLRLGLRCVSDDPEARPSMRQVVRLLDSDDTLLLPPVPPLRWPMASASTSASASASVAVNDAAVLIRRMQALGVR